MVSVAVSRSNSSIPVDPSPFGVAGLAVCGLGGCGSAPDVVAPCDGRLLVALIARFSGCDGRLLVALVARFAAVWVLFTPAIRTRACGY